MKRDLKLFILLICLGLLTLAALWLTSPQHKFEDCTNNRHCVD